MSRLAAFALVAATGLALPAAATIMVPLSLAELTQDSSLIVRGRVRDRSAAWDDQHQKIYTTAVIDILDTVWSKRSVGLQIKVRTLGGEVGDLGMKVAGTPDLKVGEEVLLFLREDSKVPAEFAVIGMNQGRFTVFQDSTGRVMAKPTWDGIAFAKPGEDGVLRVGGEHELPVEQTYVDLRKNILELKARPAPTRPSITPPSVPSAPAAPKSTTK